MVTDTLVISIMPNDFGMGGGCSQGRRGGTGGKVPQGLNVRGASKHQLLQGMGAS